MKAQKKKTQQLQQEQEHSEPLSQDDLIALQNEHLKLGNIKFLSSLNPDAEKTYGIKNKPRDEEPSMAKIFSWGYEAPVANDYISNGKRVL